MNPVTIIEKSPKTLDELVTILQNSKKSDYHKILESTYLESNSYDNCSSWSNKSYTRNCIARNDKFELILLCWEKGQQTPIHDHGGEECWVKVIEGSLNEMIYKKDKNGQLIPIKKSTHCENSISYMVDFMGFHSLENINDGRTTTLHLYAKPILNCNIFNDESNSFVRKEMTYTTKIDLIK